MADVDFDAILFVNVLCDVLSTIDGAVATSCTSETNLQMGEASLLESCHVKIDEPIDTIEESEDFAVGLKNPSVVFLFF